MASGLGQNAIASLLVAGGADVSILNQEGESPLDHAEYRKNDDIMKLLKEAIEKVTGDEAEGECGLRVSVVDVSWLVGVRVSWRRRGGGGGGGGWPWDLPPPPPPEFGEFNNRLNSV